VSLLFILCAKHFFRPQRHEGAQRKKLQIPFECQKGFEAFMLKEPINKKVIAAA
jgi:hypothetical protein